MEKEEILNFFNYILDNEPDVSAGIAAIRTLLEVVKNSKDVTVLGVNRELDMAYEMMKARVQDLAGAVISSSCKLFMRYITLNIYDVDEFSECKRIMLERGQDFIQNYADARVKIAKSSFQFILEGAKILTHSRSRVVLEVLKRAAEQGKNFQVFITQSAPNNSGEEMHNDLQKLGITSSVIYDSAIGSIMHKITSVVIGAEAVVESGGIINKIGTFAMALCAKAFNREVYVVAESFKFTQYFPDNQDDMPDDFKKEQTLVDYTPPEYIRLIISDLGVIPPSAMSLKLYELYL